MRYGEQGIANTLKKVKGTYGLAIMAKDRPHELIAARNGSPLVIGIGNGGHMFSSDISALLGRVEDVIYMNDGEMVVLTKDNVKILDISKFKHVRISKRKKLSGSIKHVKKNRYPHFMLKEIFEQPESIYNSFRGRIMQKTGIVKLEELERMRSKLKNIKRIIITGCGTAYLAGSVGKLIIEELAGIPCEVILASELRYHILPTERQNLAMVAIYRSGETVDTLAALRCFKKRSMLALGIVNVSGSTIAREADAVIYNRVGPEIGVASTKAFTSQVTILALLAIFLGRERGFLSGDISKRIIGEIEKLPMLAKQVLGQKNKVKLMAKKYKDYNNFLYIGRKYNFPVALEGALKLKEVSYIHAEGYGAGEMKHGPIAMIDENFPTLAIAPVDSVYDKMVSNMEEIKARRGKIIAITTEGNKKIEHIADDWLYIPKTLEILTPILAIIPLQLFAYYMGMLKGFEVDKPKNLAKSVTVE